MAAASPFFATHPLNEHGLEFIFPPFSAAHPFEDGSGDCWTWPDIAFLPGTGGS